MVCFRCKIVNTLHKGDSIRIIIIIIIIISPVPSPRPTLNYDLRTMLVP
jgi:hypothetical protein